MTDRAIGRVRPERTALSKVSQTTEASPAKDPLAVLRGSNKVPTDITSPTVAPSLNGAQGATGPPDDGANVKEKKKRQRPLPDGADPIVREPECQMLTGLSRTTRWRLERTGNFPARISLSENAVGWRFSAIKKWLAEREAE